MSVKSNSRKSSKLIKVKALEDLSREELLAEIEALKTDIHITRLQNNVYEEFLKKNDPKSLDGKEKFVEEKKKEFLLNIDSKNASTTSTVLSSTSIATKTTRRDTKLSEVSSRTVPSKITLPGAQTEKLEVDKLFIIDVIEHEIEEQRQALEALEKEFNTSTFSLQAETETAKLQLGDVLESHKQLEQFVAKHTNPLTGKISADKYIKHVEQGLKKKDQYLRKMKLETTALLREYRNLKTRQQQKLEMMERLHPIDIEKLKIENKELGLILDTKTRVLYETKHEMGEIGQNLVLTKNTLNNQSHALKNLILDSQKKEPKLTKLRDENELARNTVMSVEKKNRGIKTLMQTYKAPGVLDYVKKKLELANLNNEVKVSERRCKNQQLNQSLLIHKHRQLAGEEARSIRLPFKKSAVTP